MRVVFAKQSQFPTAPGRRNGSIACASPPDCSVRNAPARVSTSNGLDAGKQRKKKIANARHLVVCGLRGEDYRISQGLWVGARINDAAGLPRFPGFPGGRATQGRKNCIPGETQATHTDGPRHKGLVRPCSVRQRGYCVGQRPGGPLVQDQRFLVADVSPHQ